MQDEKTEHPDDQWRKKFVADREGAIVGARTAQRFGWKIGDRIPIKNVSYGTSGTWEFNIDGIYHSAHAGGDETQFWFQWDYFEERVPERFKGNIGWYVLRLDNPDDAPRVAKAIDDTFTNSSYETKTETESAFAAGWVKQFGNIEFLILSIGIVVFFTLLLITGNTMAIAVRERVGELAVLKAIGFSDFSILVLVLAQASVIALLGGILGLGLAILACRARERAQWFAARTYSFSRDSFAGTCDGTADRRGRRNFTGGWSHANAGRERAAEGVKWRSR